MKLFYFRRKDYKMLNTYIVLILIYTELSRASTNVFGNFQLCIGDSTQHTLSTEKLCEEGSNLPDKAIKLYENAVYNLYSYLKPEAYIFSKHNFILNGYGYECTMKMRKFSYEQDFLNNKYLSTSETFVELSPYDCMNMVKLQRCNKLNMECKTQDMCNFKEPMPSETYKGWYSRNEITNYECSFHKRIVVANTKGSQVFQNAIDECLPQNLYCRLANSIVIWNADLLRTCTFERLEHVQDLQYDSSLGIMTVFSEKLNLLFKLTGSMETDCNGIQFHGTSEGLYLAFDLKDDEKKMIENLPISNVSITHLQDKDIRELLLAETDKNLMGMIKIMKRLACSSMTNIIRSNLRHEDYFFKLNELGLVEVIIYFKNGLAYLPYCKNITEIIVISKTNKCYEHIPIKFYDNKSLRTGFLRDQGIITLYSKEISCSKISKIIYLEESLIVLNKTGNKVSMAKYNQSSRTHINVPFNEISILGQVFDHNSLLINSPDIVEGMNELIESIESGDSFYVKPDEYREDTISKELSSVGLFIKRIGDIIGSWIKSIEFWLVVIVLVVILSIFLCPAVITICSSQCAVLLCRRKCPTSTKKMSHEDADKVASLNVHEVLELMTSD